MNAVFVALDVWSGVGGIQRYSSRVARALGELAALAGGRVRVVAFWDNPRDVSLAPPGVEAVAGGRSRWRTVRAFVRALRELHPEAVIYGHVLLAPLAVLGRTFAPRARHLLLVHGIEVWGDAAFRRVPRWERWLVARVFDRIVTVSRLTGVRMRAAYGISEAVFRRLAPAVEDEGPGGTGGAGGATVLTVARLGPDMEAKGVKTLVEAMPALVRLVPEARLRIVGDGPRRAELAELARQLGVGDRVELAGRVSDEELERAYASAAVFALPSRQEGFGIVYLEAWRHSLPVVAGDADAGAEVVEPGVTGLLVPPGDARALAEALADLLRDPERRRRMGEAGRAAVAQRWTHRRFRDQLEAVLRDETETAA